MKATEFITEISRAQARQQKEEKRRAQLAAAEAERQRAEEVAAKREAARLEKSRRMLQAKISVPEPPPPIEPAEPESEFTKAMRELERQQQQEEDQIYGVDFKFETVVDRRTRTKRLYGYWTKERIQLLGDVQRINQYRDLGDFRGTTEEIVPLFELFKQIGDRFRHIHILFDQRNMAMFPGLQEVPRRLNEARRMTKRNKIPYGFHVDPVTDEIVEYITWEVVDRQPGTLN